LRPVITWAFDTVLPKPLRGDATLKPSAYASEKTKIATAICSAIFCFSDLLKEKNKNIF